MATPPARGASQEAALQLHRLHFVEKRGQDGIDELMAARRKEREAECEQREAEYRGRLRSLKSAMDTRIKEAFDNGSMSVWAKEERNRWEEARQAPDGARQKAASQLRDLETSFRKDRAEMADRVKSMPPMNVRTKEELQRLTEEQRQAEESSKMLSKKLRERAKRYQKEKAAMLERALASPQQSFWTKEQRAKIEERRQNPDDAQAKAAKRIQELEQQWNEQRAAMDARVATLPNSTFWTPEERRQIDEIRGGVDEVKEQKMRRLRELSQTDREARSALEDRLKTMAKKTFWSKEETAKLAEAREDPFGGREKLAEQMRENARTYYKQRAAMAERVRSIPRKTFMSSEQLAQRSYLEQLKQKQSARRPEDAPGP